MSCVLTLASILVLCHSIGVMADETVVHTKLGTLQGKVTPDGMAVAFRGVPYAEPPVGDLRWNNPKPVTPWGSRTAFVDGTACRQDCILQSFACPPTQSEDCLYVNIFRPRGESSAPLPVMVFLHGGNFRQGWGGGLIYDGRYIANQTDTILVTVNYRLGILGFMASDGLEGNYGLMDQQMALSWVQENIAAFGGSPQRVTLFGQSAGAMSTAIHMLKPNTQGLFHQAIVESTFNIPIRTVKEQASVHRAFAKRVGCEVSDLACQRKVSADDVVKAQMEVRKDLWTDLSSLLHAFVPFTPTSGTALVPEQPRESWNAGDFTPMPLLLGDTAQEAVVFIYEGFGKPVKRLDYDILLDAIFGLGHGIKLVKEYPLPAGATDARQPMSTAATDGIFLCANRNMTRHVTSSAPMNQQSWTYIFDHPSSDHRAWGNISACYTVSCHGQELPFVFHALYHQLFNWTADEAALSQRVVQYWTNFVHSGNPNVGGPRAKASLMEWPLFQPRTQSLRFHTPADIVDTLYDNAHCDFWDSEIGYDWHH